MRCVRVPELAGIERLASARVQACIRDPACNDTSVALWDGARFGAHNWLIGDDADTTVAASSCAYDRLVVSDQLLPRVAPVRQRTSLCSPCFHKANMYTRVSVRSNTCLD